MSEYAQRIEIRGGDDSLTRLCEGLNVAPLLDMVKAKPELWSKNTWRQDIAGGQQDTESIMLRWASANTFASIRDSLSVENTEQLPELMDQAVPLINEVAKLIGAQALGRIFIVKLKPGGRVYPHADIGVYADTFERFHICLESDPQFTYFVQHPTGPIQFAKMAPGELWWFNHKRVHWAHNGGTNDRIVIIYDAVVPAFRKERDTLAIGIGYQYEEKSHVSV